MPLFDKYVLVSQDQGLYDLLSPLFVHRGTPLTWRKTFRPRYSEGTVLLLDKRMLGFEAFAEIHVFLLLNGRTVWENERLLTIPLPFDLDSVYDRIQTALSDLQIPKPPSLKEEESSVSFFRTNRTLNYGNESLFLTRAESMLIEILVQAGGRFVSVTELAGVLRSDKPNTVSAHLSHIRRKSEMIFGFSVIRSGRNAGYALRRSRFDKSLK